MPFVSVAAVVFPNKYQNIRKCTNIFVNERFSTGIFSVDIRTMPAHKYRANGPCTNSIRPIHIMFNGKYFYALLVFAGYLFSIAFSICCSIPSATLAVHRSPFTFIFILTHALAFNFIVCLGFICSGQYVCQMPNKVTYHPSIESEMVAMELLRSSRLL